MKVEIIGAGPGGEQFLTVEARERITRADAVIATDRLYQALSHLNSNMVAKKLAEIPDALLAASRNSAVGSVAVLVSGDSGFFSLGKTLPGQLRDKFGESGISMEFVAGLSSLQYFCSRLGISYEDARVISLHGRDGDILPFVSYNPKVFALTGGEIKAHDAVKRLADAGMGLVRVSIGENLGCADERIVTGMAEELYDEVFSDLACMIVRNDDFCRPYSYIPDNAFVRSGGRQVVPMTKQAVRTLAIAALGINPGDVVVDVGAGTGSVSVEMARKAFEGAVYAVERDPAAIDLLRQNRLKFGAFNMHVVRADAPSGLERLPVPDKAFIGGSGRKLWKIMSLLFTRNSNMRMVVTAITLESLNTATEVFQSHGFEPEISCINAAVAHKVGGYRMMKAENPVYIISGGGNAG